MPSQEYFVRDPREVPFLNTQLREVLALAQSSSSGIQIKEVDDFGFMAAQFLYKQIQHAESILHLVPSRDSGLIARTMIDGLYQLLWTAQSPEDRSKLWRSFSVIHDWRLMQGRLKEGLPVEEADIKRNATLIKEFGALHEVKPPKANAKDPYHRHWRGAVSLSRMADLTGRELYDGPYVELSDWEHWGVSGIGDAMSRKGNHVTINPASERVSGLSLLAAFQCLHQTLELVDWRLSLGIRDALHKMAEDFKTTLDGFRENKGLL